MILVTPYVVEAMNPEQVSGAAGRAVAVPGEADLVLGTDMGGPRPTRRALPARDAAAAGVAPARFRGQYGFSPAK